MKESDATRFHAAAKIIELDGTEGYFTCCKKFGDEIVGAVLVTWLRAKHATSEWPTEELVDKVNEILYSSGKECHKKDRIMGWNAGYSIFERTVIGAYDLGKLDKALLCVLMEPYQDTDIDSGGRSGLLTKDGKNVEQVVCEIWGFSLPKKPHYSYNKSPEEWDNYYESLGNLFNSVTEHFGWE
jgi:hypothetical protein